MRHALFYHPRRTNPTPTGQATIPVYLRTRFQVSTPAAHHAAQRRQRTHAPHAVVDTMIRRAAPGARPSAVWDERQGCTGGSVMDAPIFSHVLGRQSVTQLVVRPHPLASHAGGGCSCASRRQVSLQERWRRWSDPARMDGPARPAVLYDCRSLAIGRRRRPTLADDPCPASRLGTGRGLSDRRHRAGRCPDPTVSITAPEHNSRIWRNPEVPPALNRLVLKVVAEPHVPQVVWYVDGESFAVTDPDKAVHWPIQPGTHRFQVRLPLRDGVSRPVRVVVE